MARSVSPKRSVKPARPSYILDEQIGFILRQVSQRHATIFAREIGINLTPTQWAALAKLNDSRLGGKVPYFGEREVSRAEAMVAAAEEWAGHYSQLAVYLRLNGLLPPTAKPRQE